MRRHFQGKVYDETGNRVYDAVGQIIEGVGRVVAEPTDEAPCPLHPDWRPDRWLENQPRSMLACPGCRAEKLQTLARAREENEAEVTRALQPARTAYARNERAAAAMERYAERRRARGYVEPGSAEEQDAIERSDELRRKVIAEDHRGRGRPAGRFVCSKIENGAEISFYEQRIGGRKVLVQVGPS